MRNKTLVIFILILFTIGLLLLVLHFNNKAQKDFTLKFYKTPIYSKIIVKEIDFKNHHARVIRFFDFDKKENWHIQINTDGLNFDELWDKSIEGDVVIKLENSLSIEILKKDSSKLRILVPDYNKYIQ